MNRYLPLYLLPSFWLIACVAPSQRTPVQEPRTHTEKDQAPPPKSKEGQGETSANGSSTRSAQHPPSTPPTPTSGAVIGGEASASDSKELVEALKHFKEEAEALTASLASCTRACQALASMERAAHVLCDLTREKEPSRCEDAQRRLREARTLVRNACGACAGGPRTDADTPDP